MGASEELSKNLDRAHIYDEILFMPKLIPLNDRVIVKAKSKQDITKSGIVLPDTVDKDRPEQGEVIATGPGKLLENGAREPIGVKVGQIILFTKYAPNEVKVEEGGKEVEYLVISASDILAIVE